LTILFSMAVASLEATLDLNVPHFVTTCQTQTSMAERASPLSIRVKITMPWQVVRWHGAVILLNLGLEEKPTSEVNSTLSMPIHNVMSTVFSIQEIALTILFSMAVALLEATLDLNVPHFVTTCQTQTSMAERASPLSIRVKITMPWQVVRWHGAVILLNLGLEEKPTSKVISISSMATHNAMSTIFRNQEIALTILFSMAVVSLEATLDLNVPHFVMICPTQTIMAERASLLSIRVKITMPWQVVRWHGDVIILNLGLGEIPTSKRSNIMLQIPK